MMIKNIKSIKNMAVYEDFDWNKSVRDKGNNIDSFKRYNILYGRNYSGKTTASRIIRSLETGVLSDKYPNAEFLVEIEGEAGVTQNNLKGHSLAIRVFNEDFVRDNLQFIVNSEESIKSFAILGDNNNKLEHKIKELEGDLGSDELGFGLLKDLKLQQDKLKEAEEAARVARLSLEAKLSEKANKAGSGIKYNKLYGYPTYNIQRLKEDIQEVCSSEFHPLDNNQIDNLRLLLKEEPRPKINQVPPFNLQFKHLADKARQLVEKKIQVSETIQELLDDALLQNWVRSGRTHHQGKRSSCGFCGNPLPPDLYEKLDRHFNQESVDLETDLDALITQITNENTLAQSLIEFDVTKFYSGLHPDVIELQGKYKSFLNKYLDSLSQLISLLKARKENIFTPGVLPFFEDGTSHLDMIRTQFNDLIARCNEFTTSLGNDQKSARITLRLQEVSEFVSAILYFDELETIKGLDNAAENAKVFRDINLKKVNQLKAEITDLKNQLKDETKGAERVNFYLNNYFGHESLSLKAVQGEEGYRFEVMRNGEKAYNLSEGECSLVAFCYFIAKLEDTETKNNNPVVWIDDPISSLDVNHIFFVYSLINSRIVSEGNIKQLFISTHNLDFLKYLKRLPGAKSSKNFGYFIFERGKKGTKIAVMPNYLKFYVTEFNYLFHQIYKCATADVASDVEHDCYYNFGNNARKFLEAFLYYKYPNANEKDEDNKLARFFGDDQLTSSLTDRINNEFSHLSGVFERSTVPIDVPEMKTTAQFILRKIEENDIDQYKALLQSIGVSEDEEITTDS